MYQEKGIIFLRESIILTEVQLIHFKICILDVSVKCKMNIISYEIPCCWLQYALSYSIISQPIHALWYISGLPVLSSLEANTVYKISEPNSCSFRRVRSRNNTSVVFTQSSQTYKFLMDRIYIFSPPGP